MISFIIAVHKKKNWMWRDILFVEIMRNTNRIKRVEEKKKKFFFINKLKPVLTIVLVFCKLTVIETELN